MLPGELALDLDDQEEQKVELDRYGNFKRNAARIEHTMPLDYISILDIDPLERQKQSDRSQKAVPTTQTKVAEASRGRSLQPRTLNRETHPSSKKLVLPHKQENDWNERIQEIEALANSNPREALIPLVKVLNDKDWVIRKKSAKALGRIKDRRAIEPLIKALGDKYWQVREAAGKSIIRINPDRAVESLAQALDNKNWRACQETAALLGELHEERAIPPLSGLLSHEQIAVRRTAVKALGKIGEPATPLLFRALEDEAKSVRDEAVRAQKRMDNGHRVKHTKETTEHLTLEGVETE